MVASSLKQQLSAISKQSQGYADYLERKNKNTLVPTILFPIKEAADQDSSFIYDLALNGIAELSNINSWWKSYFDTISENDASIPNFSQLKGYQSLTSNNSSSLLFGRGPKFNRSDCTIEENNQLNLEINLILKALAPFILLKASHKILEYLIRRARVHEFNIDQLVTTILPFHESPIFLNILKLTKIEGDPRWSFLKAVIKNHSGDANATISSVPRSFFVERMKSDTTLLLFIQSFINSWMENKQLIKYMNINTHISFYTCCYLEYIDNSFLKLSSDNLNSLCIDGIRTCLSTLISIKKSKEWQIAQYSIILKLIHVMSPALLKSQIRQISESSYTNKEADSQNTESLINMILTIIARNCLPENQFQSLLLMAIICDYFGDEDWTFPIVTHSHIIKYKDLTSLLERLIRNYPVAKSFFYKWIDMAVTQCQKNAYCMDFLRGLLTSQVFPKTYKDYILEKLKNFFSVNNLEVELKKLQEYLAGVNIGGSSTLLTVDRLNVAILEKIVVNEATSLVEDVLDILVLLKKAVQKNSLNNELKLKSTLFLLNCMNRLSEEKISLFSHDPVFMNFIEPAEYISTIEKILSITSFNNHSLKFLVRIFDNLMTLDDRINGDSTGRNDIFILSLQILFLIVQRSTQKHMKKKLYIPKIKECLRSCRFDWLQNIVNLFEGDVIDGDFAGKIFATIGENILSGGKKQTYLNILINHTHRSISFSGPLITLSCILLRSKVMLSEQCLLQLSIGITQANVSFNLINPFLKKKSIMDANGILNEDIFTFSESFLIIAIFSDLLLFSLLRNLRAADSITKVHYVVFETLIKFLPKSKYLLAEFIDFPLFTESLNFFYFLNDFFGRMDCESIVCEKFLCIYYSVMQCLARNLNFYKDVAGLKNSLNNMIPIYLMLLTSSSLPVRTLVQNILSVCQKLFNSLNISGLENPILSIVYLSISKKNEILADPSHFVIIFGQYMTPQSAKSALLWLANWIRSTDNTKFMKYQIALLTLLKEYQTKESLDILFPMLQDLLTNLLDDDSNKSFESFKFLSALMDGYNNVVISKILSSKAQSKEEKKNPKKNNNTKAATSTYSDLDNIDPFFTLFMNTLRSEAFRTHSDLITLFSGWIDKHFECLSTDASLYAAICKELLNCYDRKASHFTSDQIPSLSLQDTLIKISIPQTTLLDLLEKKLEILGKLNESLHIPEPSGELCLKRAKNDASSDKSVKKIKSLIDSIILIMELMHTKSLRGNIIITDPLHFQRHFFTLLEMTLLWRTSSILMDLLAPGHVDYLQSVILGCLEQTFSKADGNPQDYHAYLNVVRIDLLVQIIQISLSQYICDPFSSPMQLMKTGLRLLSLIGKILPKLVLTASMPLVIFMTDPGNSSVRIDNNEIFKFIQSYLKMLLPALFSVAFVSDSSSLSADSSSSSINDNEESVVMNNETIIGTFVDAFDYIPSHRRILIYKSLAEALADHFRSAEEIGVPSTVSEAKAYSSIIGPLLTKTILKDSIEHSNDCKETMNVFILGLLNDLTTDLRISIFKDHLIPEILLESSQSQWWFSGLKGKRKLKAKEFLNELVDVVFERTREKELDEKSFLSIKELRNVLVKA